MFRTRYDEKLAVVRSVILSIIVIGSLIFHWRAELAAFGTKEQMVSDDSKTETDVIEITTYTDGYEWTVDGNVVGIIRERDIIESYASLAEENIVREVGYTPEFDYSSTVHKIQCEEEDITEGDTLLINLEEALYDSLDEILVQACVLKIDDFTVAISDENALIEVMEAAQNTFIQDDSAVTVTIETDVHNSLVLIPEIHVLSKSLPEDRTFVTSAMLETEEAAEAVDGGDEVFLETAVKDVTLEQEITAVKAYVSETEIVDVATAVEMITKEHQEIKTYEVVKGDVPSVIAQNKGLSLEELYAMNPGLKANERCMQIGDDLVVDIPEPELYVTTVEDVVYSEIVDREVEYVDDSEAYIGTNTVINAGSDGLMEVRATVTRRNGVIVNQEITNEKLVVSPVSEKQSRGIKALPITTATGTFEVPLISYTFSSKFGTRWGRLHAGIDLAAPIGTSIKASDGGRVIQAGWRGGYGYCIEIDHGNGYTTKYGHCSKIYVSVGEDVSQYETIGAVGNTGNSTGPHCHFEILKNGVAQDPENYVTP